MQNVDKLNPPIQYNWIWLLIGGILLLGIGIWYAAVMYVTRRQKLKQLQNLKQLPPLDLNGLKFKYLQLIEAAFQRHSRQETDLRQLHVELSHIVRDFVHEGRYLPAPYLTLSDLKSSPYGSLARLIEAYYPEEFSTMTTADANASVQAAKGVVTQWPY